MQEDLLHWTARPIPNAQVLKGQMTCLVKITADTDTQQLQQELLNSKSEDWRYLSTEKPLDEIQCQQWIQQKIHQAENTVFYSIHDEITQKLLGIISFLRIDPANGVLEIGSVHFFPAMQKTRSGTETLFLMLQYVFDELGYRRCEWKCDSQNSRSIAAAIRYGFEFEGIFKKVIVYKGRNRDTAWFAMTDDKWEIVKWKMKRWLKDENFDGEGQQKLRLSYI